MHTGDGGWGWCEVFYLFIYFFIGLLPPFIHIHRYGTRNLNRRINLWNWILYYLYFFVCYQGQTCPESRTQRETLRGKDTERERERMQDACFWQKEKRWNYTDRRQLLSITLYSSELHKKQTIFGIRKGNLWNYVCAAGKAGVTFHLRFSGTFSHGAFYHLTALGGIIRGMEHVEPRTPTGQEQMAESTSVSG